MCADLLATGKKDRTNKKDSAAWLRQLAHGGGEGSCSGASPPNCRGNHLSLYNSVHPTYVFCGSAPITPGPKNMPPAPFAGCAVTPDGLPIAK